MVKKILIGVLIVVVIMQFFRIDKTNPAVNADTNLVQIVSTPEDVQQLLRSACYDCHSFETVYPWYTNIAPVSWWLKQHVNEAREELNFSEWGTYSDKKRTHKIEEMQEALDEEWMPLDSYKLVHGDANLTRKQRDLMLNWVKTLQ
jgi:hypothetical protein